MEREIVLSSYSVKNKGNNKPEKFTTTFYKPIILDSNVKYVIGLNRIINMSFTWFNVNPSYKNQLIRYSSDSGLTFEDIEFPAGVWNYTDFNTYIKNITKTGDTYPISLEVNEITFRVTINLAENYRLDLTKSNFNELIGFDKKMLSNKTNTGPNIPNLSQDTDLLNIHCDLISESLVDGEETDIIFSFSTSTLQPSYSFIQESKRVTFSPVNKNIIKYIEIRITDGKKKIG